jgi:hypothetical protein
LLLRGRLWAEEVNMSIVSLIVMEPGSHWPGHVGDTENVVAAACGEQGLLQRAEHMVEVLRGRHQAIRVAVLACNDATDVASAGRRAEIARVLLRAVAPVTFGRLVVCAPDRAPVQLRHQLLSLADALIHELEGTSATVALRFGGANRESPDSASGFESMRLPRAGGEAQPMGARS